MSGSDSSSHIAQPSTSRDNDSLDATQTINKQRERRHLIPDIERFILEWRLSDLATQDTEVSELALICREFHEVVSTWRWRYVQWPRYVDIVGPKVKTALKGNMVVRKIVPMSVAPYVR